MDNAISFVGGLIIGLILCLLVCVITLNELNHAVQNGYMEINHKMYVVEPATISRSY